jgi:guanidinobutyrase
MSEYNQPLSGNDMPRFAGPGSMFRLPCQTTPEGLDVCFIGVGLDTGTSNRTGARFGPRQIRQESTLVRPYCMATGAAPFDSFQIADLGDVPINTFNLTASISIIQNYYEGVLKFPVKPFSIGGDHSITLPILRAVANKHGPVAVIHIDAHTDTNDCMFGEKITHGTVFRRAIEEGLIDTRKMVQVGVRATGYSSDDFEWSRQQGVMVIPAEECWHKSLTPHMTTIRQHIGATQPTYISFDIDALDPSTAPGTGTPEPGGLTSIQALEMIRGGYGLNIIGADLVEVSPPYDSTGNTALLAANLLFEMLCSLPGCNRRQ